jgi:hypothetical protein
MQVKITEVENYGETEKKPFKLFTKLFGKVKFNILRTFDLDINNVMQG